MLGKVLADGLVWGTKTAIGAKNFIGGVQNGINTTVKTVGNATNFLMKYWYVPVIIGGVVIGYLILRKNPATKTLETVAAIAAAAKN